MQERNVMADAKAVQDEKPKPPFVRWIDKTTAKVVAEKLRVSVWAVYNWRRNALGIGGARPDPSRLGDILALAGGQITAADIYPPKEKKRRKKTIKKGRPDHG
jgi:hypothetical protein